MKVIEKPIAIEEGDSFKIVLSKYGALALDKQENLSELIGETVGDLDIEKGIISFDDISLPVQILGFYSQDLKQWSWAWDNEDIFGDNLIKLSKQIKDIGDEFEIGEFNSPDIHSDYNDCHSLAMTATAIFDYDAYYAVSEDGIDIFVVIKSDLIKENNSVVKFRDTYLTYDNSFKGAKVYYKDSPLKLSTTQLSDYANCPFKYYLGRILNVDPFEETTDSVFGQIVHTLLEHSLLDDSYDVNKHYDQLVNESNVSEEIKILWSLSLKDQIVNMVILVEKI